jgi:hypothetical protein
MLITADAIIAHAIGDYLLQSDWMAQEKTKKAVACLAHAVTYTLPFLFLTTSWKALTFILVTHFVIDHWRLARYIVWAKNFLAPASAFPPPWSACKNTGGYPPDRPPFMWVWLMILGDNIIHVILNGVALKWLTV